MLSPADLAKVIDIPSDTEKQNKIEAIELEAMAALRTSISNGSPELARSLRGADHRAFQIGLGRRSKPGPRAFAKFTKQALNYRRLRPGTPAVVRPLTAFVKGLTRSATSASRLKSATSGRCALPTHRNAHFAHGARLAQQFYRPAL